MEYIPFIVIYLQIDDLTCFLIEIYKTTFGVFTRDNHILNFNNALRNKIYFLIQFIYFDNIIFLTCWTYIFLIANSNI